MQFRIVYFDRTGERKILKPNEANEIRFTYEGQTIVMVSRMNTTGAWVLGDMSYIFLRVRIDGRLKLLNYYSNDLISTGVENVVLEKDDGPLFYPPYFSFDMHMADYFEDCPALQQKIQKKVFGREDINAIVKEYNSNCGE